MSPARPSVLLPLLWSRFRRHRHPHQHHAKKNRIFIPKFTPFSLLIQFYYLLYPISIKKVFFLWPFLCSYYKFVCVHIALMSRGKVRSAPKICVCAVKDTLQCVHPPVSTHTHTFTHTYLGLPMRAKQFDFIWVSFAIAFIGVRHRFLCCVLCSGSVKCVRLSTMRSLFVSLCKSDILWVKFVMELVTSGTMCNYDNRSFGATSKNKFFEQFRMSSISCFSCKLIFTKLSVTSSAMILILMWFVAAFVGLLVFPIFFFAYSSFIENIQKNSIQIGTNTTKMQTIRKVFLSRIAHQFIAISFASDVSAILADNNAIMCTSTIHMSCMLCGE